MRVLLYAAAFVAVLVVTIETCSRGMQQHRVIAWMAIPGIQRTRQHRSKNSRSQQHQTKTTTTANIQHQKETNIGERRTNPAFATKRITTVALFAATGGVRDERDSTEEEEDLGFVLGSDNRKDSVNENANANPSLAFYANIDASIDLNADIDINAADTDFDNGNTVHGIEIEKTHEGTAHEQYSKLVPTPPEDEPPSRLLFSRQPEKKASDNDDDRNSKHDYGFHQQKQQQHFAPQPTILEETLLSEHTELESYLSEAGETIIGSSGSSSNSGSYDDNGSDGNDDSADTKDEQLLPSPQMDTAEEEEQRPPKPYFLQWQGEDDDAKERPSAEKNNKSKNDSPFSPPQRSQPSSLPYFLRPVPYFLASGFGSDQHKERHTHTSTRSQKILSPESPLDGIVTVDHSVIHGGPSAILDKTDRTKAPSFSTANTEADTNTKMGFTTNDNDNGNALFAASSVAVEGIDGRDNGNRYDSLAGGIDNVDTGVLGDDGGDVVGSGIDAAAAAFFAVAADIADGMDTFPAAAGVDTAVNTDIDIDLDADPDAFFTAAADDDIDPHPAIANIDVAGNSIDTNADAFFALHAGIDADTKVDVHLTDANVNVPLDNSDAAAPSSLGVDSVAAEVATATNPDIGKEPTMDVGTTDATRVDESPSVASDSKTAIASASTKNTGIDRPVYEFNKRLVDTLYAAICLLYPTSSEPPKRNGMFLSWLVSSSSSSSLLSPLIGTEYNSEPEQSTEIILRFEKFFVFETVARIPYFAYLSVMHLRESLGDRGTHNHNDDGNGHGSNDDSHTSQNKINYNFKRIEKMRTHYAQADNELHHLLIMEALGGNARLIDRMLAHSISFLYYWFVVFVYAWNEQAAYHLNEVIEDHAYNTYDEFLALYERELKALPVPDIARKYYEDDFRKNPNLFEAFCAVANGQKSNTSVDEDLSHRRRDGNRPHELNTLYDVFRNVRDDEKEHWMALCNLVQHDDIVAVDSVHTHSTKARDGNAKDQE